MDRLRGFWAQRTSRTKKLIVAVGALVALGAIVVLYFVLSPVALAVVILLAAGVGLELRGLWTIWLDLEDVERKAKEIKDGSENKVGVRAEIMAGWIRDMAGVAALPRRRRGLTLIAVGLALQTAANVIALWS